jgi:RNA-directed DNA polymerase
MSGKHKSGRGQRMSTPAGFSGAATHETEEPWDQIDWDKAERTVTRLQARIVKATRECRWNKVRALQHLLTRSFSGKVLAVRRVTTNRGRKTPGVDGETWKTPAQRWKAVHELRQHGYRPQPLRRVYIEKRGTTRMRPLGIPVMNDRAMQALYLLALNPVAETTGDEDSYGFRPERSTADAIQRCFQLFAKKGAAKWILEGDIVSCFDRISHDWLRKHVPMEQRILRQWLKAGFMDKSVWFPTEDGTPQGGIISPVLANLALDGLQRVLQERFPKYRSGSTRRQVNLVRYADDFIVTGDAQELLEDEVRPLVAQFLTERGLTLSTRKTRVTHIEAGFDFLGQTVRKYDGKLLIKPSKEAIHAFLREIREVIRESNGITAGRLLLRLNPKIRGWANYHRHVVSSSTFSYLDHQIWEALWHWALRQHRGKGKRWVREKYFHQHRGRQWVFTGQIVNDRGNRVTLRIFQASTVRIRRHVMVRSAANPFDPEWETYFEDRHRRFQEPTVETAFRPCSGHRNWSATPTTR